MDEEDDILDGREFEEAAAEEISGKKESMLQRKKQSSGISKIVCLLLAAEAAVYFWLGEEGIRIYGVLPVFAIAGGYLIWTAVQKFISSKYEEDNETTVNTGHLCKAEIKSRKEPEPKGIVRQEKAEKKEQEELNILFQALEDDTSPEEPVWEDKNTQLLTGVSEKEKRCAALESLSKDRGDIEIPYVPFLIGKHREMNDFILDYPTVSRLHLRIDQKEDVYIFTDMNSTNGTTVNGYKLEANETVSVKEGDSIQIAGLNYRFREFL